MNKLILGFKREYWEYRRMIMIVPLIFSVLVILASAAATYSQKYERAQSGTHHQSEPAQMQDEQAIKPANVMAPDEIKNEMRKRTPVEFVGFYIGLAWLTSIIYLLSTLYSDRKDKSVLYWKSLPVSETRNALIKLVFGAVVFPLVALAVAWVVYLLLAMLGLGAVKSIDSGENWEFVERTVIAVRLFIWPLVAIFLGLIWGAPLFCYTLMVSAMSKRSPFLLFILPPIVIAALEGIFFSSSYLAGFFFGHFPFVVLAEFAHASSVGALLNLFFIERGAGLFMGLLLAAAFFVTAIWYRNNRFEI